jgi:transcriptional regulator with PAS, ATPase and Fis domain
MSAKETDRSSAAGTFRPRILVTSAYPQFTQLVRQVSKELGLGVKIIEAVLDEAARLVRDEVRKNSYEVVVSRGGTAEAIRTMIDIPVITAEINDFDLLQALWRAKAIGTRIAYLGTAYREIYDFDELVDILGVEIKQYRFRDLKEMEQQIIRAGEEGIEVICGGSAFGQRMAISRGMKGILVHSSHRTVTEALERAVEVIKIRRRDREYYRRLSTMMQAVSEGVVCIDAGGKVLLVNENAKEFMGLREDRDIAGSEADVSAALGPLLGMPRGSGQRCSVNGTELVVNRVAVASGKEHFGEVFTMQKVVQLQQLEQKIRKELHSKGLVARFTLDDIVTREENVLEVIDKARSFARTYSTILIRGESGSGKELFAQGIHRASDRAGNPFVAINCAALPNELLESELFGYEEGAFTGASKGGKPGLFELAHGGTIFLDEIGSITLNLQARLLRVLQGREVMRIGGNSIIPVDVRCIAATNEDLQQAIKDGRFRLDLYFRINVLNLVIPPLRSRPGDIPLLAGHFLKEYNPRFHRDSPRLPASVTKWMKEYGWPGNVRELQNFCERLVILTDGRTLDGKRVQQLIAESDEGLISRNLPSNDSVTVTLGTLEKMEDQLIAALEQRGIGNQEEMARFLGISRTTLWKRLNKGARG